MSDGDDDIRSELGHPDQVFSSELDRAIFEASVRFPDSFGGSFGEADGTETVYATRAGLQQIAEALESDVGPPHAAGYRVIPVQHSLAELDEVKMNLSARELEDAGIEIVKWGADPRSNTVKVAVLGDPSAAAEFLDQRYGRGWFTVEHTPSRMVQM